MHASPRVRAASSRLASSRARRCRLFLVAAPAAAQPDLADRPPPRRPGPPAGARRAQGKVPSLSLALERVGGIGYAKAASSESDSVSLVALGVGGVTPNPFAVPRVGLDFISSRAHPRRRGRLHACRRRRARTTARTSARCSSTRSRRASVYRIPLSDKVDLTPRAGSRSRRRLAAAERLAASSRSRSAPTLRSRSASPTRSTCSPARPSTTRSWRRSRTARSTTTTAARAARRRAPRPRTSRARSSRCRPGSASAAICSRCRQPMIIASVRPP